MPVLFQGGGSGGSLPEVVSSSDMPVGNVTIAANYSSVIVRSFCITTSVIVTLGLAARLRIL